MPQKAIVHTAKYPEVDVEFINTKDFPVTIGCTLNSEEKPFTIGPSRNTDSNLIKENKAKLNAYLKTKPSKSIYLYQTHSDNIYLPDSSTELRLDGGYDNVGEYDAAISNIKGSQINLSVADCGAVILFHRDSNTIACIHSGWKGTEKSITEKTIIKFAKGLGKSVDQIANSLVVWLLPSATGDAYEVGEEFIEKFPDSISLKAGKVYFDNKKEIISRLTGLGVKDENIHVCASCTIGDNKYHSFRREGELSGRMNAFVRLEG
jgi:YfiH family protein